MEIPSLTKMILLKYLGILELCVILGRDMKELIRNAYMRRLGDILKSRILITAVNPWLYVW